MIPAEGAKAPAEAGPFPRSFTIVHLSTAIMFLILLVSGVILYVGPLEAAVGDRGFIEAVHIYAGVGVLLPFLISFTSTFSDVESKNYYRLLSRWTDSDRRWMARFPKLDGPRSGRFNAGQKINANLNLAGLLLMLVTGLIMAAYIPASISTRQGATFLHDLLAFVLAALFIGHLTMALSHPRSLRNMFGRR